jgi:hypothetical protein
MVEIYNFSGDSVSKVVLPRIDTEEQNCCFFLGILNKLEHFKWILSFVFWGLEFRKVYTEHIPVDVYVVQQNQQSTKDTQHHH